MSTSRIAAAIANARDVYECHPVVGQALDYLQEVLKADAEAALADAKKPASVARAAGPVAVDLVLKIDTSAVEAALAMVERLKAALSSLSSLNIGK